MSRETGYRTSDSSKHSSANASRSQGNRCARTRCCAKDTRGGQYSKYTRLTVARIDCGGTRCTLSGLVRLAKRTDTIAGSCQSDTGHGVSSEDEGGTSVVCVAQADRRAPLWHHQIGTGISLVLFPWLEKSQRGIASGLPLLECKMHGHTRSKVCISRLRPLR